MEHAFKTIDSVCERSPIGYWVNCCHPSFVHAGEQSEPVLSRFIGIQANASSCDQSDLDGSATLQVDDIPDWGMQMIELNRKYGVKILGGCCSTSAPHLQFIVDNIKA